MKNWLKWNLMHFLSIVYRFRTYDSFVLNQDDCGKYVIKVILSFFQRKFYVNSGVIQTKINWSHTFPIGLKDGFHSKTGNIFWYYFWNYMKHVEVIFSSSLQEGSKIAFYSKLLCEKYIEMLILSIFIKLKMRIWTPVHK